MSGPFSYPLLRNEIGDFHNTYGEFNLALGEVTVSSDLASSSYVILLSRKTLSTITPVIPNSGTLALKEVLESLSFTAQSSVRPQDDGQGFYLILVPSSSTSHGYPVSLPYIVPNSLQTGNLGTVTLSSGSVTVNNPYVTTDSVIFVTRIIGVAGGTPQTYLNIQNGSFTLHSTYAADVGEYNVLILTPASSASYPTGANAFIPALSTTAGSATIGKVSLSNGIAVVNTTEAKTTSYIFISKASSLPDQTFTYYIASQTNGSFQINSTSATDTSAVFWWIINPPSS